MAKIIDLKKSVYNLTQEYPEIIDVMQGLGFADITKPGMLNTVGRFMTLPKGAAIKGLRLDAIKAAIELNGFKVQE